MTFARSIPRVFTPCVAATVLMIAGLASAQARPLDEVVASGKLRVVAYDDNKPFSFRDGGEPKGIDVEIGHALAKALGVAAEIILRMPGEEVDDDLRANVWRGPLTGGGIGDVMLHVPTDRELKMRNPEVSISAPYFEERVAVAHDAQRTGVLNDFSIFHREKIAVKLGTAADYFLMLHDERALQNNVVHFTKMSVGIEIFTSGEAPALMGVRSELEGALRERGAKAEFAQPPMPGITRTEWLVGIAVHENSRDLGYAIANALTKLRETGELARICARYGVTYSPPSGS